MNIHSSDRMYRCQYCIKIFGSKKDFEKHVSDTHISHFSSSESNAITSKKREEYQTEQFESTLLKRMTKEEKTRKRTRGHTGNHQACIDDARNIWEIFVSLMSTDSLISHVFSIPTFSLQFTMACRNLCERLYSKIIFGKSHYEGGKKYCRRCEVYYYHDGVFCTCCGMALRTSPTNKKDKERLRQLEPRREQEQDRVIRVINGIMK